MAGVHQQPRSITTQKELIPSTFWIFLEARVRVRPKNETMKKRILFDFHSKDTKKADFLNHGCEVSPGKFLW
jgi:hypothetical protein